MKEITPMTRAVATLSRRGLMTAAAGAAAFAATTQLLPSAPAALPAARFPPTGAGTARGYRLTEHVKHYYRTTLV
jgi:hypothetical protein